MEFMAVSSYGSSTTSSGVVRILKDLDRSIEGEHILVVEDIIDSGLTLSWLLRNLASRSPASIEIVAMFRKPEAAKVEVPVRYVGFDIENKFVVGYGLDYAERYRDLPYVGRPAPVGLRRLIRSAVFRHRRTAWGPIAERCAPGRALESRPDVERLTNLAGQSCRVPSFSRKIRLIGRQIGALNSRPD